MPQVSDLVTIIRRWFFENIQYHVNHERWGLDHVIENRPDHRSLLTVSVEMIIPKNDELHFIACSESICVVFADSVYVHKNVARHKVAYAIKESPTPGVYRVRLCIASPTFFDDLKLEIDSTIAELVNAGCILKRKMTYDKSL